MRVYRTNNELFFLDFKRDTVADVAIVNVGANACIEDGNQEHNATSQADMLPLGSG